MDFMKDHLIPHITGKLTKEMYEALTSLYQSVNVFEKLLLKKKITHTRMNNTDTVAMIKITDLRDELFAIDMKIDDEELVPIALNSFSPPWEYFLWGVCIR